jgi:hypothetical protein
MEDEYTGKNVNLSSLADQIVQFFTQKRFVTTSEKSENELLVVAAPESSSGIVESLKVHIAGEPARFKVRFDAGTRSNAFVRYGTLTSLLGGGIFALKGLRSLEALEKLEKEFWVYVDKAVWSLAEESCGN